MLDQAERLQRQFFHIASGIRPRVGAAGRHHRVRRRPAGARRAARRCGRVDHHRARARRGSSVSALRPFPCRGDGAHIHRLEIPYGRFERRIALPLGIQARSSWSASSSPTACSPSRFAEGRRMNTKVLVQRKPDRPSAAGGRRRASARRRSRCRRTRSSSIPMRNTVLFPGVITPDHGRAHELGRGGAGSGAHRAQGRLPPAARPAEERRQARGPLLGRHRRAGACATSPAPKARTTSWCRACRASACSNSSRAGRSSSRASQMVEARTSARSPKSRRASSS